MRILLQTDMEGVSRITDPRECWPVFPEYWQTGRRKLTADVLAAARGLLDGGAHRVVVKNGHGTGGWPNLLVEEFPEQIRMFSDDDRFEDFDAAFQLGLHARCGTPHGFISHTNVPEFRIRVNGALITESHDDAWTVGLPLLGITGNSALGGELDGSLADTPFLDVQQSTSRVNTAPAHGDEVSSLSAIRAFAARCALDVRNSSVPRPPESLQVEISLRPDLADLVYTGSRMTRQSPSVLTLTGSDWRRDVRPALGACIAAALRPWSVAHGSLDLSSREQMQNQPADDLTRLRNYINSWMETNYPAWED